MILLSGVRLISPIIINYFILITSALLCIDNEYVAACLLREIEFGLLYRSGVLWKKEHGNTFKRFE